jgi:hypothetical protein
MGYEQIIKAGEQLVTKIERAKGAKAAGGAPYTADDSAKQTLKSLHIVSKSRSANADQAQKLLERAKANIGSQGSSLFETFEKDSTNAGVKDADGQSGQTGKRLY